MALLWTRARVGSLLLMALRLQTMSAQVIAASATTIPVVICPRDGNVSFPRHTHTVVASALSAKPTHRHRANGQPATMYSAARTPPSESNPASGAASHKYGRSSRRNGHNTHP